MPTGHLLGLIATTLGLVVGSAPAQSSTRPTKTPHDSNAAAADDDWRAAETGILENHVQLTFADRFYKAGESYFSPDDQRVIFQAVEVPPPGVEPDGFYAMFVGDVVRDRQGRIKSLNNIVRVSPEGSADTCGWFHPNDPNRVLFGSTIGVPSPGAPPGYDRGSGRYRWMFPPEMRIVEVDLAQHGRAPETLVEIVGTGDAYHAEGALSPDGRHLVYCSLATGKGDLYVMDLESGKSVCVADAPGYDGGPFFSPDGRRLCYRSDRRGNHLLQLFVADLAFDDDGRVTGVEREYQLTDNAHVNWAPYWHPDGRHLVYATSTVGHHNYEVFAIDADSGDLPTSPGPVRYGTRNRRVTHAEKADVLPTFSHDGGTMIWTSQRGPKGKSQIWAADFVLPLDEPPATESYGRPASGRPSSSH